LELQLLLSELCLRRQQLPPLSLQLLLQQPAAHHQLIALPQQVLSFLMQLVDLLLGRLLLQ
jgi:hypothetical protein